MRSESSGIVDGVDASTQRRGGQPHVSNKGDPLVDSRSAGYEVAAIGKVAHGRSVARYGFDFFQAARTIPKLGDAVRDYLSSRQSSKPLCLFVGTSNPHVSWTSPSTFDPAEVELPPHHLDTPATREHRAAYYQEIKDLDAFLGELRAITEERLGDDALFIHTSDHGSQWPFGKWNLYDYGTRVPFIASWPGRIAEGTTSDAMISWIDLLPTLIDIAGGTEHEGLDGRSFLKVLLGEEDTHREVIFTTHTGDGTKNIYPMRSIRTRRWKLIRNLHPEFAHTNHSDLDRKPMAGAYWTEWGEVAKSDAHAAEIVTRYFKRPEWELYRVERDPWEQTNLIDSQAQADRVANLKQRLAEWMKHQGDKLSVHSKPRRLDDESSWQLDFFPKSDAP